MCSSDLYTGFAVVAVLVNLATQRVVLSMGWQSDGLALAMEIGRASCRERV